jgi:23S rRNA (guanosine2251-2'-O)-methyltransferase
MKRTSSVKPVSQKKSPSRFSKNADSDRSRGRNSDQSRGRNSEPHRGRSSERSVDRDAPRARIIPKDKTKKVDSKSSPRTSFSKAPARAETTDARRPAPQRSEPQRRVLTRREEKPQLVIWGRRTVSTYLERLQTLPAEDLSTSHKGTTLVLLADKDGKVPNQLKDIVQLVQNLGLKTRVCRGHEDETWPLNTEESIQHQRVALLVDNYPTQSLYDIPAANSETRGCVGVVLDQIQDPRNFGAILRSSAFFGCTFAVYGEDRQAQLSSTVFKASAGGAFQLQLAPVVNIGRALRHLKDLGYWIVGSALEDDALDLEKVPVDRPYILVVGNEGKGIRQEIANKCDYIAKIPGGNVALDSLNVGVAAGIMLATLRNKG